MSSNYTVLARKYRSQDFKSLIGQDVLVKTLTTAINTARIAQGYVLTGIRGTGKTSTARIFAKALNCLSGTAPTDSPCGVCENCVAITSGQHIDVLEIDAASHTGVDNIRDILAGVQYRPTNSRYKVYIIDEVHMLSAQAFNALLKTLEEPPQHVIFILATTEVRKIPVTILSRCQRFDLARVPVETLKNHFDFIAKSEGIELETGANELIANAADGSVRDGLSLLDQAIAQTGGKVTENSVMDMLKRADRNIVMNLMGAVLTGDVNSALTLVDSVYTAGTDLSMLLIDMMEWAHWATRMHPALKGTTIKSAPYSEEQKAKINEINKSASLNTLSRLWQVLVAAVPEMAAAGNQKQCFDMIVIRMVHIADMPSVSDILKQNASAPASPTVAASVAPVAPMAPVAEKTEPSPALEKQLKEINSAVELGDALTDSREILLYAYYNDNVEISEIANNNIKYFDRKGDASFGVKLLKFLNEYTGKNWTLDKQEQSENIQTVQEIKDQELESDDAIAEAQSLFGTSTSDIEKI